MLQSSPVSTCPHELSSHPEVGLPGFCGFSPLQSIQGQCLTRMMFNKDDFQRGDEDEVASALLAYSLSH